MMNNRRSSLSGSRSPSSRWFFHRARLLFAIRPLASLLICISSIQAEQPQAPSLLARALHFADLYNWADAAPAFTQAEKLFAAAGDRRNELYATLGRIRSNIEREQQTLPAVSAQLAIELEDNPLLQNDNELRMFCLIVKGDIDTETNTGAMRQDWQQVQTLAEKLGNAKWQYRALAQLGVAAFYDADIETARKNVGTALALATKAGDAGAQIRFLTMLANGLVKSRMYEQALPSIENALKIASGTPDAGYQFTAQEIRINALIGLKQLDAAERLSREVLARARSTGRTAHEATVLGLAATVAQTRNDDQAALATFDRAISIAESAGLTRVLAIVHSQVAFIHRENGDLESAQLSAEMAAVATQESGDMWSVPERLKTLAELHVARGKYREADSVYDRAEAFVDSMIGNASTVLDKTALIRSASEIYSQHFALIAERFKDPDKAYGIIEQVRGRVASDLLRAGSIATADASRAERTISQLQLKLMTARSTADVRKVRDQIFMAEQSRWVTPGVSILKTNSHETVGIKRIQQALAPSTLLLEYVMADPMSYCFVVSRTTSRIVRLSSKAQIEAMVADYLNAVKAKQPALAEARRLYDALLGPIVDSSRNKNLVIVRDGQLHRVPFGGLREVTGHYIVEKRNVIYAPSATTFYLLAQQSLRQRGARDGALLAIGGVPYSGSGVNRTGLSRGDDRRGFPNLPSSTDEVYAAQSAFRRKGTKLLLGKAATEAAFKGAELSTYRTIHLAVHGFADSTHPDRASLVMLSDPSSGEDGFLQSSEIVQLRFNADLIVLSACDTAVGPLQGQDGIANLSRAFLLAGARTVVSTLWQIDDGSSLFLMKRFYAHLGAKKSAASALTAAKRDMLRTFGRKTLPYRWAAFTIEGAAEHAMPFPKKER